MWWILYRPIQLMVMLVALAMLLAVAPVLAILAATLRCTPSVADDY